jgi:hypothetical protein
VVGPAPAPSNRRYQELLDDAGHRYALSMLKINMRCIDDETMFRVDISRLRYRRVRFQNNRCRRIIDMFLLGRNWQFRNFEISISESCFRKIKKYIFIFFIFWYTSDFHDVQKYQNLIFWNIETWCPKTSKIDVFWPPRWGGYPSIFRFWGVCKFWQKMSFFWKKFFIFFQICKKCVRSIFDHEIVGFQQFWWFWTFQVLKKCKKMIKKMHFLTLFSCGRYWESAKNVYVFAFFASKKHGFFMQLHVLDHHFWMYFWIKIWIEISWVFSSFGISRYPPKWDLEIPPDIEISLNM